MKWMLDNSMVLGWIRKHEIMVKITGFILFSLLLAVIMNSERAVASYQENQSNRLKQELTQLISHYNIPGVVITYGCGQQSLRTIAVGYDDVTTKVVMSAKKYFRSGSTAKSMTAALILQLVQAHKLKLDETLAEVADQYRGEIKSLVNAYHDLLPMTIRELLNHTSGVPQSINTESYKNSFARDPNKYWSARQLIDLAMKTPVYFKSGTKGYWSYTNTDYILLAIVIKSVTGKSIVDEYQKLWHKTGISNIFYANRGVIPKKARHNFVYGYVPIDDYNSENNAFRGHLIVKLPGLVDLNAYQLPWNAYNSNAPGAGGVILNSYALAKWYRDLFQRNVLSEQSKKAMLTTVRNGKFNDAGYGLGVTVHKIRHYGKVISHDGLTPGFSVIGLYFARYKLVLVLMTNSSNQYVSTFNVHNGKIIPRLVTKLLPSLIKNATCET